MTVKELVSKYKHEIKSFYFIPNLVRDRTFHDPYYYDGFESSIVPKELANRKVIKCKKDSETSMIVIWENLHFNGKEYEDIT